MERHILLWLLYCLPLFQVIGVSVEASSTVQPEQKYVILRAEFEAFRDDMNRKMDQVLNVLTNDGYLAQILQGPQGQKGERGERGEVGLYGVPGPPADLGPVENRLDEIERIIRDAPEEIGPKIIIATDKDGVKTCSTLTSDVRTVAYSSGRVEGVAWDPSNRQIYFSTRKQIFRANEGGTQMETVLDSALYGGIWGLTFEYITGNLYGVSGSGYVFVCRTARTGPLRCATLLTGYGILHGIAVSPNHGKMYFTEKHAGRILRADTDGTNAHVIATGLNMPAGIIIDYPSGRLYWADHGFRKLQSSNMDAGDRHDVFTTPEGHLPWGIALHRERLYWSYRHNHNVQSINLSGGVARTLFQGKSTIQHLTITASDYQRDRVNDCEGNNCTNVCVLSVTSFRCMP